MAHTDRFVSRTTTNALFTLLHFLIRGNMSLQPKIHSEQIKSSFSTVSILIIGGLESTKFKKQQGTKVAFAKVGKPEK